MPVGSYGRLSTNLAANIANFAVNVLVGIFIGVLYTPYRYRSGAACGSFISDTIAAACISLSAPVPSSPVNRGLSVSVDKFSRLNSDFPPLDERRKR